MKVCIFTSGYLRTLLYIFKNNIKLLQDTLGECDIDVYYSFWDKNHRNENINDLWHIKIESNDFDEVNKQQIDEYFFSNGVNSVHGEIESFEVSEQIIFNSSLPEGKKALASQYYKINRVAEKYFSENYDLYITMRPDVSISNFISKSDVCDLNSEKSIIVNQYYWYNGVYNGNDCNEYIWLSTKETFIDTNSQFLNLDKLVMQISHLHGEAITGMHFKNLFFSKKISSIKPFNFNYRVFR